MGVVGLGYLSTLVLGKLRRFPNGLPIPLHNPQLPKLPLDALPWQISTWHWPLSWGHCGPLTLGGALTSRARD